MSDIAPIYAIGKNKAVVLNPDEFDEDPRGLLWIYEPPRPNAAYVMGVDPSGGITQWNRALRTEDDYLIDNGAIEVIRVGKYDEPDVQVAEFAAPIDPYDLAGVCNFVGRMYGGGSDDGQALAIIEVWPGPGLPTLRELISRYGYTNHYVWRYDDSLSPRLTTALGWRSGPKTVQTLWINGSRHLRKKRVKINSSWFVEEMTDVEPTEFTVRMARGAAGYGKHDDRVTAMLLAIWAAHEWDVEIETRTTVQENADNGPSWQASDISIDGMMDAWEDKFAQLLDE